MGKYDGKSARIPDIRQGYEKSPVDHSKTSSYEYESGDYKYRVRETTRENGDKDRYIQKREK